MHKLQRDLSLRSGCEQKGMWCGSIIFSYLDWFWVDIYFACKEALVWSRKLYNWRVG